MFPLWFVFVERLIGRGVSSTCVRDESEAGASGAGGMWERG